MPRSGLSLLEVIIALAVLAGSAVILSQMVDLGSRHADRAIEITDAQTIAHNVVHEILIGQRPLVAVTVPQPVDIWSPWDLTLQVDPVGLGDLQRLTVAVFPGERSDDPMNAVGSASSLSNVPSSANPAGPLALTPSSSQSRTLDKPASFRLTRWIRRKLPPSDDSDSAFAMPTEKTP